MEIGRVLRASTQGFTCGTRSSEVLYPSFGAFVMTQAIDTDASTFLVGVITSIRIDDDPLVRQLIMANSDNEMVIRDQRENRMVPVEIDVLSVGYVQREQAFHTLPPRPPMSLDYVHLCDASQIAFFTDLARNPKLSFLRLILTAGATNTTTELLAAVIRHAAQAQPPERYQAFLISAGRELARMMSHDPLGLQHILQLIQPT